MVDETTNLVLEHLRHIRAVVDDLRAEMKHFIILHVADATQNVEIDRIKERLERVERRLELTER